MYSAVGASAPLIVFLLSLVTVSLAYEKPEVNFLIKEDQWPNDPRKICYGCNCFESLLYEGDVVFDKSLLIKEFLEDKNKFYVITCPRDWSKSVNLQMLRQFLTIEVDENENPILPVTSTLNYNLFVNGKVIVREVIFSDEDEPRPPHILEYENYLKHQDTRKTLNKPFLISKHRDIVDKYLGKWPVIYFYWTMTGRQTWWDILYDFRRRIRNGYRVHHIKEKLEKLIARNDTEGMDIAKLQNITNYIMEADSFHTLYELGESGVVLTEILYRYFKKKVFIFVDDYDRVWNSMLFYDKIGMPGKINLLHFYAKFINKTIVNNPYVEKAILTGIFQPWSEPYFPVFDKFVRCNMMTGKFMEYYGLNQWQMEEFYKVIGTNNYTKENFTYWFDGYRINHRPDLQIYNPWSIAHFTNNNRTIEQLWASLRCMERYIVCFAEIPSFKKQLYYLIKGGNITIRFRRERFTWTELEQLHAVWQFEDPNVYGKEFVDKIFMFFYQLGYLTLAEDCDLSHKFKPIRLKIPNEENRLALHSDLRQYFSNSVRLKSLYLFYRGQPKHNADANVTRIYANPNITYKLVEEFTNFLFDNETVGTNLEKAFQDYILHNGSYIEYAVADETREIFYDLLYFIMIDINCTLNELWTPSEVTGRPDALLICHDRLININMKFEQPSIENVMEGLANPQVEYAKEFIPQIHIMKTIAINVHRNGTVQTLAELMRMAF